ncbi:COG4315 family predicted lipoprotein [Lentzea sp. CA-135723]|uniref:COG4315 family predicted lipoprotein n=1 Tax=Lentzea sp. CA-135723 TaxID=3239950 RepID=UPI003D9047E9
MPKGRVVVLVALLLTGACSSGGETEPEQSTQEQSEQRPVGPIAGPASSRVLPGDIATVQVVQLTGGGEVLADTQQYTLYRNEKDATNPPKSSCNDECVLVWPPLLAPGNQFELKGVDKALVGTMKREDGTLQVTLAGRPLYRYVDDEQAGDLNGNGVDGQWFAVAPSGEKARG